MSLLFSPLQVGSLTLPNRIVMAPLTRRRASEGRVPNALMAQYYKQRADAGLIIAEATSVIPQGVGYLDTPGIWSPEQVEGWKLITNAVHEDGGRIYLQLWHVGRLSHSELLNGELPVSSSAVAAIGQAHSHSGHHDYEVPRALRLDEIPGIIEGFRVGAINALEAGFDGVEVHGANGYLPDQFLRDGVNNREDEYGGPIENRARLLLEITDKAIEVWGKDRVGVRLSTQNGQQSMSDSDPVKTFGYAATELGKRGIAYLHVREAVSDSPRYGLGVKQAFQTAGGGAYMANQALNKDSAEALLEKDEAELVAFGVPYIANPDLVRRLEVNAPWNAPQVDTFYYGGPNGYIDYPTLTA